MMLIAKCEQMRHQLYLKRVSPGRVDTIGNLKWHISDILYFPLHTAWRYAPWILVPRALVVQHVLAVSSSFKTLLNKLVFKACATEIHTRFLATFVGWQPFTRSTNAQAARFASSAQTISPIMMSPLAIPTFLATFLTTYQSLYFPNIQPHLQSLHH